MEGSEKKEEETGHLQRARQNLEEVLKEALEMLTNLEDLNWIQRFLSKGSVDSKFERLNKNLTDHTQSLMLSLNIDFHTFNMERMRMEDEVDHSADLKDLDRMKDCKFQMKNSSKMQTDKNIMQLLTFFLKMDM